MWRSVGAAERAVVVAQEADAPIGDLPTVTRQLSAAAQGVDALLRASAGDASSRCEVRAEVSRVVAAADDVRRAAVDSLRAVTTTGTDDLVTAARVEVTALAAGLRAVRSASRHRPAH
jgi:hypothetical protein